MNKIDLLLLNARSIQSTLDAMAVGARLTQQGHKIHDGDDFARLYNKKYSSEFIRSLCTLPHPTLQKFGVINIAVVGASRRFLAQITRHQNEVKFMSSSLQYSDFSSDGRFVVPYHILERGSDAVKAYNEACEKSLDVYRNMIGSGLDNDSAGYVTPQSLRTVILISATPYQWAHMIGQRVCRRNTDETRIVMLLAWMLLEDSCPELFGVGSGVGAWCQSGACKEGKMSCGKPISSNTPQVILEVDYPKLNTKRITEVPNEN